MSYTEIVIDVSQEQAELLSTALMDAGALSVAVEDADAGTQAEKPQFGEPGMDLLAAWEHSRLVVLLDADADAAALLQEACALGGLSELPSYTLRQVAEQDWVRLTQSQFDPIKIGQRIWVVPSWHEAPEPDALVLELDPGLAFGTGSHPTTGLCMEWLEQHAPRDKSVLDYGCGSGILALVAAKLGAREVLGVDIDPQAVDSAGFNAARNHCESIRWYLPDDFIASQGERKFDVVVANILSSPLKLLAPMLAGRVAEGGALVLSGVLERQAQEVIAAYAPFLKLSVWRAREGWVALAGTRGP